MSRFRDVGRLVLQDRRNARGLDFASDLAFAGLSQLREAFLFNGIPIAERFTAEERTCGVSAIDRSNGRVIALMRFETAVQEVLAVIVLPGRQYPPETRGPCPPERPFSRPCLPAELAYVPDGEDRVAKRTMSMTTAYWIAHPRRSAFISALSPDGVGQLLESAEDWPAGAYAIRTHEHEEAEEADGGRIWGIAMKDASGDVWIEPERDGEPGDADAAQADDPKAGDEAGDAGAADESAGGADVPP